MWGGGRGVSRQGATRVAVVGSRYHEGRGGVRVRCNVSRSQRRINRAREEVASYFCERQVLTVAVFVFDVKEGVGR